MENSWWCKPKLKVMKELAHYSINLVTQSQSHVTLKQLMGEIFGQVAANYINVMDKASYCMNLFIQKNQCKTYDSHLLWNHKWQCSVESFMHNVYRSSFISMHLLTVCFMNISLQSSEQNFALTIEEKSSWNVSQCRQINFCNLCKCKTVILEDFEWIYHSFTSWSSH